MADPNVPFAPKADIDIWGSAEGLAASGMSCPRLHTDQAFAGSPLYADRRACSRWVDQRWPSSRNRPARSLGSDVLGDNQMAKKCSEKAAS